MQSFVNSFFDDDECCLYDIGYYISKKGYCFRTVFVNGKKADTKRISEQEYMSAYDCHINA